MRKLIITFAFLFCSQCVLTFASERDLYLLNIEKALDASQQFENSKSLNLREEIKRLFLQIYENEKAHPDFIQCMTAQDSLFYAYQVIAKELYSRLYGLPREDFEFLRFPTQNLIKTREEFFLRYPSLTFSRDEMAKEFKTTTDKLDETLKAFEKQNEEEFLKISKDEEESSDEGDDDEEDEKEETPSRFKINDTLPEISRELLSVNFTMETFRPLDSAMFVFLSGNAVSLSSLSKDETDYKQKFIEILYELFDPLSIPREQLKSCLEKLIEKAPRTKFGIINQIFLPKENLSNIMYLSFGGGFLHPVYDSKFEESYREFQKNRQEESFRTFRNFQARIIAGSLFENPQVKILRYTLIPDEIQRQYEATVREAIDELIKRVFHQF